MSEQGERPPTEDDWWTRLYDDSAPDTGPAPSTGDTLDDRFDSASDTVSPDVPPPVPPDRSRTWWETPAPQAVPPSGPRTPSGPSTGPTPPGVPRPSGAVRPQAPGHGGPGGPPATGKDVPSAQPAARPPSGPPRAQAGPPAAQPPAGPQAASEEGSGPRPPAARPERAYVPQQTRAEPEPPAVADPRTAPLDAAARPVTGIVGGGPPTYDPEPTALPPAQAHELGDVVADTVLDGARYGTYTLRAASVRGDSARFRGEPRRDALLTARFGTGPAALVLVAVAGGARAAEGAHLAASDACRWIGAAVGRSHARLAEDIRDGRRGALKSGLHRLVDRSFGKLRARAAELGVGPEEYSANLRCLLLSADPDCRTRVFFGVGGGGLFRLRDGVWQDIEPFIPETGDVTGAPVVGFGSPPAGEVPSETPQGDRLTMDLGIATPPSPPYIEAPSRPPAELFRFRASVARPGDTLLLCSAGLADPLRGEPALAEEFAARWRSPQPPGMAAFLADTQLRVKGYADDRTAAAVWEA
ncbi:protein phosphatase 2C domain-containing protein [Streptomyces sp. NPDC002889]|uniref:protein phosphatase 2C domain-containing protein n=1 Tax=Streptomyces sp. NPDC002889 TaxID=3364669 RepID=UPI003687594C